MEDIQFDLKRLKQLLEMYGEQTLAEMITRLTSNSVRGTHFSNPGVASGSLRNSLHYGIVENEDSISTVFSMLGYGTYVDKGRPPGKQPPLKGIKDWCRLKGIPETAAFPIARNIGRYGIPATNFFTIPIKRKKDQLLKDIKNLMTAEVQAKISKYLNKK